MSLDAIDRTDVDVAGRCHLEMNLMIKHVACKRPEDHLSVRSNVDIALEAYSVTNAMCAMLQCIGDQFEVRRFTGVDCDVLM